MPLLRKNIRDLTSTEKADFIQAIKALKATPQTIYDTYVRWHIAAASYASPTYGNPGDRNAAHRGPAFNPWHRYYLYRFEQRLRDQVPGVTIPYWDWTQDAADPLNSPMWAADFMGGDGDPNDGDQVKTGPFAVGQWQVIDSTGNVANRGLTRQFGRTVNFLPTPDQVNVLMSENPYDHNPWDASSSSKPSHRNRLEGWLGSPRELHNLVHLWMGGDMLQISSPSDPVFFIHHCNIDRLWALWQAQNPSQGYQPTGDGPTGHNLNDLMYPWDGQATILSIKPADVMDISTLGYSYA